MTKKIIFALGIFGLFLTIIWLKRNIFGQAQTDTLDRFSLSVTPTPTSLPDQNIIVTEPKLNDQIGKTLIIKGQARVFENQFSWRLKDTKGNLLASGQAMAGAPDTGQFGTFEVTSSYKTPKSRYGILEIYDNSAKDGAEIDKVTLLIKFP